MTVDQVNVDKWKLTNKCWQINVDQISINQINVFQMNVDHLMFTNECWKTKRNPFSVNSNIKDWLSILYFLEKKNLNPVLAYSISIPFLSLFPLSSVAKFPSFPTRDICIEWKEFEKKKTFEAILEVYYFLSFPVNCRLKELGLKCKKIPSKKPRLKKWQNAQKILT